MDELRRAVANSPDLGELCALARKVPNGEAALLFLVRRRLQVSGASGLLQTAPVTLQ